MQRGLLFCAEAHWSGWLRQAHQRAHRAEEVRALNACGTVRLQLRDVEEAHELFRRAGTLVSSGGVPDVDRVKVLANLSSTEFLRGDLREALRRSLEARDFFRRGCPPHLEGHVWQTIAMIYIAGGRWVKAYDATRRAHDLFAEVGDAVRTAQLQTSLGLILLETGAYDGARAHLLAAVDTLGKSPDVSATAYALTELGRLSLQEGDLAAAARYGSEALGVLWSNMALLDKAEVARISELFGSIAWTAGDRHAAINDLQRASAYYAQCHLWREWAAANRRLDEWVRQGRSKTGGTAAVEPEAIERLRYLTTLLGLMDSIESLYPDLRGKAEVTTKYALLLADRLQLSPADREALSHAGRLHDVGLTSVDAEIVQRRGPLTAQAQRRIHAHPLFGEDILSVFPLPEACLRAVKHHHEKFDGSGYPDRLAGAAIPLLARIISVSEAYVQHVLAQRAGEDLPVRRSAHARAMEAVQSGRGTHFDPAVVDAFVDLHDLTDGPQPEAQETAEIAVTQ